MSSPRSLLIGEATILHERRFSFASNVSESSCDNLNNSKEQLNLANRQNSFKTATRAMTSITPSWSREDSMVTLSELSTFRTTIFYPGILKYSEMRKKLVFFITFFILFFLSFYAQDNVDYECSLFNCCS